MKYKEFKTGDYIKDQERGSFYIVGNKRNLVAFLLDEDGGWCLYEHAIEEVRHCYTTRNVYGDFVYCTDEEIAYHIARYNRQTSMNVNQKKYQKMNLK